MRRGLAIFILSMLMKVSVAQDVIPLYGAKIPGAKPAPADYTEIKATGADGILRISRVTEPTLTVFAPETGKANGTAVIICPGGGYGLLSFDKEGTQVAARFAAMGVTAFVLKYRLPDDAIMEDKSMAPLQDALQAIYLIRKNAALWKIDARRIGIMGFSAGGHLAASLAVHYNDVKIQNAEGINLRPDFALLIYPVISFGGVGHAASIKNLLGDAPSQNQRNYFSLQNYASESTPPTFMVHANNDTSVPVKNSILFNEALVSHKVPVELHLYQGGGHGFGLENKSTREDWFDTLQNWLRANNFVPAQ